MLKSTLYQTTIERYCHKLSSHFPDIVTDPDWTMDELDIEEIEIFNALLLIDFDLQLSRFTNRVCIK